MKSVSDGRELRRSEQEQSMNQGADRGAAWQVAGIFLLLLAALMAWGFLG
jgi:hypothetical protein